MIRRRSPLGPGVRLLCFLLTWVPALALLVYAGRIFVAHVDYVLARSAPLVSAEASRVLEREVRVERISPDFSLRGLWEMVRSLPEIGTVTVTLENVAIANGRTLEESGALAAVPSGTVVISLPRLLANDVSTAIPRIVLQSPTLLVERDPKGRFNFQDLVRPRTGPPGPPFRTVVIVHDGRLILRDYAARFPARQLPATNWFSAVEGMFDLSGAHTVRISAQAAPLAGTATAGRVDGPLTVQGTIPRGTTGPALRSRGLLSVQVDNALAPYWFGYLFPSQGIVITEGRADVRLGLVFPPVARTGAPAPPPRYVGGFTVRGGRLIAQGFRAPIENVNGTVQLDTAVARIEGAATVAGARGSVSGAVWNLPQPENPTRRPRLALSYALPRVPIERAVAILLPRTARLPRDLRIGGMGSIRGTLQGSIDNPIVAGNAAIPTITYRDQTLRDINARISYASGIFSLPEVTARAVGGELTGRAVARVARVTADDKTQFLQLPQITVAFAGRVRGAQLAALRLRNPAVGPIRGSVDVEVVGKVVRNKLTAAANVVTPGMRLRGIEVYAGRARVLLTDGQILIPALTASTSAGSARIGGSILPDGRIDLSVNAVALNVGRIAQAVGAQGISGVAYASGTIGGTIRDPVLTAQVRALRPTFRNYTADLVEGTITASRRDIVLGDDVVLRRYPARATVAGALRGIEDGKPNLDLRVQVEDVELTEILRQLQFDTTRLPKMAGVVDAATVTVQGTTENPNIRGRIDLGNSFVEEFAIDGGTAQFALDNGAIEVPNLRVDVPGAGTLTASGRLERNGDISGSFTVPNLDLEAVSRFTRRYAALEGTATVRGSIGGTRTNPVVEATISPQNVRVAGTQLKIEDARVRYVFNTETGEARLTLPQLTVARGETRIQVDNAFYDARSGRLGLTIPSGVIQIGDLLETLRASALRESESGRRVLTALQRVPQPATGTLRIDQLVLRGRITPEGLDAREVEADLSGTDLVFGPTRIDRLAVDASLSGDVLRLREFVAVNDATETTIRAEGTADFNGAIDATLQSNGANLALLRPFLPSVNLQGLVDLTITAEGKTRTPTLTASLEGRDVRVGRTVLSLVRVPAATVRPVGPAGPDGIAEGEIDTSEILILQEGHRAQITGELPFSYETFSVPENRPVHLTAEAREQSLSLVRLFAPEIPESNIGGTFSARLDMTGTLRDRNLEGFLRVVDGRLVPPRPAGVDADQINSIADADIDVRFDGKRVDFTQFSVALGAPGGGRGDYGTVTVTGNLDLSDLRTEPRVLPGGEVGSRVVTGGRSNLVTTLDKVRIVARDVLPGERGEVVRGRIDGQVFIGGTIARPLLTTRAGGDRQADQAPLLIRDVEIQLPERDATPSEAARAFPINPSFDIAARVEKARLRSASTFQVEVLGSGTATGSLVEPIVMADFQVTGGFLRLPTARFVVQRGGEVDLRYSYGQPSVRARGLVARATIYTPAGVRPSLDNRISQGVFTSASPFTTRRSTRYRITARIDGDLIDTLPGGESSFNLKPGSLDLTSDPALTEAQIIALIGSQQQIALAAQGRIEEALRSEFESVLNNVFVPSLLAPVEQSIASGLGLEEFALEYSPDVPVTFRFVKRLPGPFESFLISYSRSIGGRLDPGEPEPYDLSLYYDLPRRLQPGFFDTLQVGISTDQRKDLTYFLRGTIPF